MLFEALLQDYCSKYQLDFPVKQNNTYNFAMTDGELSVDLEIFCNHQKCFINAVLLNLPHSAPPPELLNSLLKASYDSLGQQDFSSLYIDKHKTKLGMYLTTHLNQLDHIDKFDFFVNYFMRLYSYYIDIVEKNKPDFYGGYNNALFMLP